MKIYIFLYERQSTGRTRKKTVNIFLISFLVPEILAFKKKHKMAPKVVQQNMALSSKLW